MRSCLGWIKASARLEQISSHAYPDQLASHSGYGACAAMKLSLWLEPAASDTPAIHGLMHACSRIARSPEFPPHVTLAAGDGEPTRTLLTNELAGLAQAALELRFNGVGFGGEHFYCAFLRVEATPLVAELVQRAARLLEAGPLPHPLHLSLCYGQLDRQARIEIETLARAAPLRACFDRVSLWDTSGDAASFRELARCPLPVLT